MSEHEHDDQTKPNADRSWSAVEMEQWYLRFRPRSLPWSGWLSLAFQTLLIWLAVTILTDHLGIWVTAVAVAISLFWLGWSWLARRKP